ncbi:hypothetical protein BJ138DRAFT_1111294 [Hygrophoropsis aurantiaca]|uniref:Uncharacterized protein n=1 Tax=Hygrophoropsis aurantiaca TaxID=72124 RepID=A0ACB8AJD3_9AGAM|nr:hypothetical protein BJ138DRAFT_1111294 [Hygrophoropsis aurantiaca]
MEYPPLASTLSAYDAAAFQGCILSGVPFAFMLILFVKCFQALWKRIRSKSSRSRRDIVLMAFICSTFSLETTSFITNIRLVQLSFLNTTPAIPVPSGTLGRLYSTPEALPIWIPLLVVNWCGNSLMIWRCTIIYQGCRTITKYTVFAVLLLILLANLVFGLLWVHEPVWPIIAGVGFGMMSIPFTITYFSFAVTLSTVITILIASRLLLYRHRIIKAAGNASGSHYTSITMIVVESSLLYSSCALLYLAPLAAGNAVSFIFLQMLGMIDVIASFLIIYRVLTGKAWSSHSTVIPLTTIRFGHGPENNARDEESDIESPPPHLADHKAGEIPIAVDNNGSGYRV